MVAEGLDLFRVPVPPALKGVRLRDSRIRQDTGCHVVAFQNHDGVHTNPPPDALLPLDDASELILVATVADEQRFMRHYSASRA
jgi:Trk K+ transport system NAD-binding subunit